MKDLSLFINVPKGKYTIDENGTFYIEGKVSKARHNKKGYYYHKITLSDGTHYKKSRQWLMAVCYLGLDFFAKDMSVHHIDLDKENNHYSNLLVVTRTEHGNIHKNLYRKNGLGESKYTFTANFNGLSYTIDSITSFCKTFNINLAEFKIRLFEEKDFEIKSIKITNIINQGLGYRSFRFKYRGSVLTNGKEELIINDPFEFCSKYGFNYNSLCCLLRGNIESLKGYKVKSSQTIETE